MSKRVGSVGDRGQVRVCVIENRVEVYVDDFNANVDAIQARALARILEVASMAAMDYRRPGPVSG
jgi:16S rRNA G527 N7-methylase RsmG